ncbi:barstar family protein [Streptomyces sp. RB6PN25]|uniref:Barstar family protein n=1 Tax=Streptomyces humicola TaxID=2953240 RepID=A0ABT1PR30_9ACTN|nr:barstar family protein [Streptomyces humicola]MCQ4080131.1 barstar family protein [Streptomyces humicola]
MTVVVLDLDGVTDKAAFMDRCARSLRFPEWFGRNWDALLDCLTDPDWMQGRGGRILRISGWQDYAAAAPEQWRTALAVFRDAAGRWSQTPTPLRVELTGPAHPTPGTSG